MILTPCTFLGVSAKMNANNVVVMTSLGTAYAVEEIFRSVLVSAVVAKGELMINGANHVSRMNVILGGATVHHRFCLMCNPIPVLRRGILYAKCY